MRNREPLAVKAEHLRGGAGFTPDEAAAWRKLALDSPAHAPLLAEIRAEGERLLRETMPLLKWSDFKRFQEDGDRHAYESAYFARRKRLTAFGLLAWLEPQHSPYLEALLDTVWAVCDEYTWCLPAHLPAGAGKHTEYIDLFAAETAFTLAELLTLTGGSWPETVRMRTRGEVERRVLGPYESNRNFGWETARHNWSAVCAGSIGAAAIHLVEDADRLRNILARVLTSLDCFLEGFGEDGVCKEGYGYWLYGFGYFTYFADLLRRRSSGALDLFARDKVRSIAMFQDMAFLDKDKVVNFSDSPSHARVYLGLSHYLHRQYPEMSVPAAELRAPFADDHCGRWAPALRNLIWLNPQAPGEQWRERSHYAPDAQWLVSRHSSDGIPFGFAAKCGHNDEPHNHNDVGHFILHADGETFLTDLGAGRYSKAYFSEERYSFPCNGSQGHSVPIIDGCRQQAGHSRSGTVLHAKTSPEADVLEMELAAAYGHPALRRLVRKLTWIKTNGERALSVQDTFELNKRAALIERFVSEIKPVCGPQAGSMVLQGKRHSLVMMYDASCWQAVVSSHIFENHQGAHMTYYTLDFHYLSDCWHTSIEASSSSATVMFELAAHFEKSVNNYA